jgi:hypothetical protein
LESLVFLLAVPGFVGGLYSLTQSELQSDDLFLSGVPRFWFPGQNEGFQLLVLMCCTGFCLREELL